MRRFRPSLWPTLFTLPTLIVLVALGVWQVQRLHWKEALIEERQMRSALPAAALPEHIAAPEDLEYTPLKVRGQFHHDRELFLAARTLNGRVGLHVVTPFELADGRVLMIDRGWIPEAGRDPATRPEGQIPGVIEVSGLGRLPGWKGLDWMQPENLPVENLWFWVDPPAMAAAAGLPKAVESLYLDAGPAENPGGWPRGGQTRIELPNDHLQYAITWFSLAVALVVIYLVYHLRHETGKAPRKAPEDEEGP